MSTAGHDVCQLCEALAMELLQAVAAWAARLRWLPVGVGWADGQPHAATAWAELAIDFELGTGCTAPGHPKPRKKGGATDGQDADIGMKAQTFARCVAATEKVLSIERLPNSRVAKLVVLPGLGLDSNIGPSFAVAFRRSVFSSECLKMLINSARIVPIKRCRTGRISRHRSEHGTTICGFDGMMSCGEARLGRSLMTGANPSCGLLRSRASCS